MELEPIPDIVFQDDAILVLFKPGGWFVHPPENPKYRRGLKRKTCVQWLADVHGIKASPAHRLDAGTEGVLVFGKTRESLQNLNAQFLQNSVQKTYLAVCRGWLKEPKGEITLPLELDSTQALVDACTVYETLAQIQKDFSVNPKFSFSRYSLLRVQPKTGRWHQIRRHFNRISHPLIGDSEHGDLRHNRYFREVLNIEGLCLKAKSLQLQHPRTNQFLEFTSPETLKWKNIETIFQYQV